MMHAAIYDAVNAIDATHAPYAVRLHDVPRDASEDAAAAAAAHDVLVALYPSFRPQLDEQLQESLAAIEDFWSDCPTLESPLPAFLDCRLSRESR